jgi:hypothetical protein
MDAILFSAKPSMVDVDDAVRHLASHAQLYWEVGFPIKRETFTFPMLGYIHVCKDQVRYRVIIEDIVPFSSNHYEDLEFARTVKPDPWIREWTENIGTIRSHHWKNALVITMIEPFSCVTTEFRKPDGSLVQHAPQGYIRVQPWGEAVQVSPTSAIEVARQRGRAIVPATQRGSIYERNLEDIAVQQLESLEPGLKLVGRQLGSEAGRLDLLAQDSAGCYVVIELKRTMGTDQVVGQILRYMGWVQECYKTDKVRGIIVVQQKDLQLRYALKAVQNIIVREFVLSMR